MSTIKIPEEFWVTFPSQIFKASVSHWAPTPYMHGVNLGVGYSNEICFILGRYDHGLTIPACFLRSGHCTHDLHDVFLLIISLNKEYGRNFILFI